MSRQPIWKLVANLGDVNPLDHGGLFVFEDTTGVYPPELEKCELVDEDDERSRVEVRRVLLERCTLVNDVLSDNQFHPAHPAWFADSIQAIANYCDVQADELRRWLCSESAVERAQAYCRVLDYHGWENGDSYPLTLTRTEAKKRYRGILAKC